MLIFTVNDMTNVRYYWNVLYTSMLVLLIVGPKCTLAASHAAPGESLWVCRRGRQTYRRTDARLLHITLSVRRGQCNNEFGSVQVCLGDVNGPLHGSRATGDKPATAHDIPYARKFTVPRRMLSGIQWPLMGWVNYDWDWKEKTGRDAQFAHPFVPIFTVGLADVHSVCCILVSQVVAGRPQTLATLYFTHCLDK